MTLILSMFVQDYENQDNFEEVSLEEGTQMLQTFEREQLLVSVHTRQDYGELNNLKTFKDFFETHTVTHIIHQDSERDIYVCLDEVI